jgi:hypothetical protein
MSRLWHRIKGGRAQSYEQLPLGEAEKATTPSKPSKYHKNGAPTLRTIVIAFVAFGSLLGIYGLTR